MIISVVGFDPGQTTGYCVIGFKEEVLLGANDSQDVLHKSLSYVTTGEIDCGATSPPGALNFGEDSGVDTMLSMCTRFSESPIVMEDFILDFNKADMARHTLSPVRVIAKFVYGLRQQYLMDIRQRHCEESIFIQNRSLPKTTCSDVRLKEWGLYEMQPGGGGRHARDAVRHAYYFLRTCRGSDFKARENRHLGWPHIYPDPWLEEGKKAGAKAKAKGRKKIGQRIPGLG